LLSIQLFVFPLNFRLLSCISWAKSLPSDRLVTVQLWSPGFGELRDRRLIGNMMGGAQQRIRAATGALSLHRQNDRAPEQPL
jgi:hypothetical protein